MPVEGRSARRLVPRWAVRLWRRARALGLPRRPGPAGRPLAWPLAWLGAIWLGVFAIVAAYLLQDHRIPEPGEADLPELDCMALNIYFEARGEAPKGKRAVGHVVMNRVGDEAFPGTVCQVVRQGGEAVRDRCQFSWWCDGRSDRPVDQVAWRESREIAWEIMRGATRDPTGGALWYHAVYVSPEWRDSMGEPFRVGRHLFYRRPGG